MNTPQCDNLPGPIPDFPCHGVRLFEACEISIFQTDDFQFPLQGHTHHDVLFDYPCYSGPAICGYDQCHEGSVSEKVRFSILALRALSFEPLYPVLLPIDVLFLFVSIVVMDILRERSHLCHE